MILADKIIRLRKKNGWSQEELAEKMNVSRQAVSKWEGAQTVPDLEKILTLGNLFGVTTDYLLKDDIEDEEFTDERNTEVKRITLAQANDFLESRKSAAVMIATGVFLCIIAVIPLLLLSAVTEIKTFGLSENAAAGIGLIILLVIASVAVALFIYCGFKNSQFDFIDKEPFETEYGVYGMVREKQKKYESIYAKLNIAGICICILSPIPLFAGAFAENGFLAVIMLTVTMFSAGIGVILFIIAGVRRASMQKLLKEGEFSPKKKRENSLKETVAAIYWPTAAAVYLGLSFFTNAWEKTWIVWPVAGILFAVIMRFLYLFNKKDN